MGLAGFVETQCRQTNSRTFKDFFFGFQGLQSALIKQYLYYYFYFILFFYSNYIYMVSDVSLHRYQSIDQHSQAWEIPLIETDYFSIHI